MKRAFALATLLLSAAGLHAQSVETIPFRAALAAKNQTSPAVDANATGSVTVWLHVVRDASGKVTSGSLDFSVNYKFTAAVTLTALHIHKGAAGVPGAIVIPVPLTQFTDAEGVGTIPTKPVQFSDEDARTTSLDSVNGLLADPSSFYFDIHSTNAPGGAMRGQIQRAEMTVLMGMMSPANENPPILGTSASAVGTVIALRTLDSTSSTTSAAVIFDVNYSGFPLDSSIAGMHLNFGADGRIGPITIDSGINARDPVGAGVGGAGNLRYEIEVDLNRARALDTLYALFQTPAAVYLNVDTGVNPAGFVRAQLHRTDHAVIQTVLNPRQVVVSPPVHIDASAPGAIHIYALRNTDGSIPAAAVIFDINPRFPPAAVFTSLHIHDQVPGQNGPVTIDAKLAGFPILAGDGIGNLWRLVTVSSVSAVASLNDVTRNPERHYVDLHTSRFGNGAARAQLAPVALPIPFVGSAISSVSDPARTVAANKSLMTIFGSVLARVFANLDGFLQLDALPKSLNGTSVTIGGTQAGMLLVAPDQVIVEVPAEVPAGRQPLVVNNSNANSNTFSLTVQPVSPNIFFDGTGGIVVKNSTFSLVRPDNPAAAGDVLVIYSTGLGQTTPPLNTGRIAPSTPFSNTDTVSVTIGGRSAQVIYSIASPGFAGLYQTAVVMPAGVLPGSAALQISSGGVSSNSVNIPVK